MPEAIPWVYTFQTTFIYTPNKDAQVMKLRTSELQDQMVALPHHQNEQHVGISPQMLMLA